jgi:hypothetical protein
MEIEVVDWLHAPLTYHRHSSTTVSDGGAPPIPSPRFSRTGRPRTARSDLPTPPPPWLRLASVIIAA